MHKFFLLSFLIFLPPTHTVAQDKPARLERSQELLQIENGTVKIGIDKKMGASFTYLSWTGYKKNAVNSADPGRLIQQSYYAGRSRERLGEGQHEAWSPWTWNPIQGGGVGSWARVTKFKRIDDDQTLFGETIPKLWDMHDEEAEATMRQWTGFEKDLPNVVTVRCEFTADRDPNDEWGPARPRHQELPALYFTRNFSQIKSYLGNGKWRDESQAPGPPWGKAEPPLKVMACFNSQGQGIAVFSPSATEPWNFGPHGGGNSSDAADGPCVHLAPITLVKLGPKSTIRYRYWMVVGTADEIVPRIDALLKEHSTERLELTDP